MFVVSVARSVCSVMVVLLVSVSLASAQAPVPPLPESGPPPAGALTLTGQVRQAGSLAPVRGATVLVEGTKLETATDAQGRFRIDGVPPASAHVIIAAPGFMPLRADLVVRGGMAAPLDALLDTEVHYTEVVSVSPEARDPFAAYQPTSVLAGQELNRDLEAALGATLRRQPGVAERAFGPGASRPVIRGLDGDRVLILQDGQRVGDLSSQSGDHGVPVNPASAARIEVVRGPATLLYGANAIGGLVNLISETIPARPVEGTRGAFVTDAGTAADEFAGSADVSWGNGRWAVRGGGSARRNGDVSTPAGDVPNTQSRGGFGNVGVSWTPPGGYVGASYGYDDTRHGIPVIEEGQVELTPRRHTVAVKAQAGRVNRWIDGLRADFASRRYRHEEIVAGEVGTRFRNDTDEFNVLVRQMPLGRLTGTIGGSFLRRDFAAEGDEALSPPVRERSAAVFFYEEVTWPHVTFQFGARANRASYDPEGGLRPRDFTDVSGSLALLFRPEAAGDKLTLAVNLARASRHPALEELYFFGEHPGNFAFEIGNADLDSEHALGVDASVRWRAPRVTGEITLFRNAIDQYIFRSPLAADVFDARFGHEAHDEEPDGGHGELPFIEFTAADSLLQGVESHADILLPHGLHLELGLDYVRGELRGTGEPLPRMPPLRGRLGLSYERNAFEAGGEVLATARQGRVFGEETPTAGYRLLKFFASYSFAHGRATSTVTARLDNAANALYANHLSLVKDLVPEAGRSFKAVYSVRF